MHGYKHIVKPLLDRLVVLLLLLLLSPVWLLLTVLLWIANDGKPFFFQQRPGLYGRIFRVIKFRTMTDQRDADGRLLPDEQRLTRIGSIVRKTSLDEIPQLLNVLKGDMSLVGPRPLLVEYLPLYNATQRRRHAVRPGITGWAQVNGRNAISWEQKFEYDVWYVEHISFALDLRILWMTLVKVLRSEGISAANTATMERFTGN
ncbi:sugar transferase [Chitinophaga japonensis]|uniref:Lipopolysaccharide/colanic/teichoic acid biosynthesis glycosyltransferase n=1 Tax=Chitinophaga japonensis TaxID=104662 RepID=A0A562T072_CHIJA|nr:sugar transferase [Chitinophaga japonensis]TWI86927.1 lipopolysaccharide/colanic/teichoic acid biosynthesis glycosyltransferase [Chitinophaga japonensis]